MDQDLQHLMDRQGIWDCLLRYIRGVDRMDLDLVRSAFWEDAVNSHGPVAGNVEDFIAGWYPAQEAREISWHMVSNQQYDFAESGVEAHVETYFTGAFVMKENPQMELVGGRYADRFEKRDGQWRIATRVVLLDWQCRADSSAMKARMGKRHQGSRDKQDATYERPLRSRAAIDTPW